MAQISFAVTAKLISVFVFVTRIVQSVFFLNPKPFSVIVNSEDQFSRVAAHLIEVQRRWALINWTP